MKYLVLFCALAAVALADSVSISQALTFEFAGTDGVSVPQKMTIPFNYSGDVNISVPDPKADVMLCIHWVVPVVAPYGENIDLGKIWESTCTSYQSITGDEPFSADKVILRSGDYYVTAALVGEDIDSTGIVDTPAFDFAATFTYLECESNFFGAGCSHEFSPLGYRTKTDVTVGDSPKYFALPSEYDFESSDDQDLFANELLFKFETDEKSDVNYTFSYRLMGSPDLNDGVECRSSSSCTIQNPPFTATPGYTWGLSIRASEEVTASITVTASFCPKGTIGDDCEDYQTLNTEIGEVKKFSKKTILVFDNTVSVAVGGLDGYEQQEVAPDVDVQIDAAPFSDSTYNVLLSKGAQANVAIIDMSDSIYSKIVLTIDPSKSFGIWKVDDTNQCPTGCTNHGTCSSQEYVCMCNDKYEDLDCGHEIKDFTIEYIILIAVGSILILAIVIGVPIYCYLNRNQEYDIVA